MSESRLEVSPDEVVVSDQVSRPNQLIMELCPTLPESPFCVVECVVFEGLQQRNQSCGSQFFQFVFDLRIEFFELVFHQFARVGACFRIHVPVGLPTFGQLNRQDVGYLPQPRTGARFQIL